jgi:hypothetical protein
MFARADQLRIEEIEESFRLHAIEFYWEEFDPKLIYFDLDDGQVKEFDLDDIDFSISKKRTCVGSYVDGEYVPCPRNSPVQKLTQCVECAESLIPIQDCLFEPKCEGDLCDSPLCRKEHAVYIAFFGNRPKVGMTLKTRIRNRLIEQGADAYFIADVFPTRKNAREAERLISEKLRITERPNARLILESLRMPRRRAQIEDAWEWISRALRENLSMNPGELEFLDSYPLEEPLPSVPKHVDSWGYHSGKAIGIKGKFLIYECDRMMALNLADLPSRYLSRERL